MVSNTIIYQSVIGILLSIILLSCNMQNIFHESFEASSKKTLFIGVNMKGKFTSLNYEKKSTEFPSDYYEKSFELIKNLGMNHIRYVFYWEAYEKNPELFIKELQTVASTADRFGLHVVYDNHQYHTSSWFDPKRGTGFPEFLINSSKYMVEGYDSNVTIESVNNWWTEWWNNGIKDVKQNDGWTYQSNFLIKLVKLLETHSGTLGYEILNEPVIIDTQQWSQVGKYHTFMVNKLREHTKKPIILDMTIPVRFSDPHINMTAENMAKIIPKNQTNIVFKISLYGLPEIDKYQKRKLDLLTNVSTITNVPLYIGEWNDVTREELINSGISNINLTATDLTLKEANKFMKLFKNIKLFGWAFWNWNYIDSSPSNFNLIEVQNKTILTTKYYDILGQSIAKYYAGSKK